MKIYSKSHHILRSLFYFFVMSLIGACATNNTTDQYTRDEWEGFNRKMQSFNDEVDKLVLKPMAKAYLWTTPKPIDDGVTNFFSNLDDIGVAINDFLQFKLVEGSLDFTRFLVNTTAGIAGVIDVATMINLPKHDEDFDQTLGVWGVPMGSYLVLPFVGSSSPRGVLGLLGGAVFSPLTYSFLLSGGAVSVATMGSGVLDVTDTRAGLLSSEKVVNEAAIDRYEFLKSSYLQRRNYLVHDGKISEDVDIFLLDEDPDTIDK